MEKDEADERMERYIADAFARKGEQAMLDELSGVDSADRLKQIMQAAESKHRLRPAAMPIRETRTHAARHSRMGWSLSVAAVIAVVLFIGFQPRYSADELYMRWQDAVSFEPIITRGSDEATEEQGKQIESAISLARSGHAKEAIGLLLPIASDGLSEYQEDAQWQVAVIYLCQGERDSAARMLHEVVERAGPLAKEATELLNEMKERRWF